MSLFQQKNSGQECILLVHFAQVSYNQYRITSHESNILLEQPWFDRQFHSKGSRSIVKPDELHDRMEDPPVDIDGEIYNRIRGSIVAMSLGDALGAHVEFRSREFLVQNPVKDLKGGGTWGLEKGQVMCIITNRTDCDFIFYNWILVH